LGSYKNSKKKQKKMPRTQLTKKSATHFVAEFKKKEPWQPKTVYVERFRQQKTKPANHKSKKQNIKSK